MPAPSERRSSGELVSGAGQEWLGHSVYQVPEVQISEVRSWASMTAVSYHRSAGEAVWRGDRHRVVLTPDPLLPMLVQVEQGRTRETPLAAPGTLAVFPPGLNVRIVGPPAKLVQVLWDTDSIPPCCQSSGRQYQGSSS